MRTNFILDIGPSLVLYEEQHFCVSIQFGSFTTVNNVSKCQKTSFQPDSVPAGLRAWRNSVPALW